MRRTNLFLTELIACVLIFAVCAGVFLRLFANARETTDDARTLTRAVTAAQSVAECVRAAGGDAALAASYLDGAQGADGAITYTDDGLTVTAADMGGYYDVKVVRDGADGAVYELRAGYLPVSKGAPADD